MQTVIGRYPELVLSSALFSKSIDLSLLIKICTVFSVLYANSTFTFINDIIKNVPENSTVRKQ